nr:MAG TPA: hypothetical protein [Bacteriophage sp.]
MNPLIIPRVPLTAPVTVPALTLLSAPPAD